MFPVLLQWFLRTVPDLSWCSRKCGLWHLVAPYTALMINSYNQLLIDMLTLLLEFKAAVTAFTCALRIFSLLIYQLWLSPLFTFGPCFSSKSSDSVVYLYTSLAQSRVAFDCACIGTIVLSFCFWIFYFSLGGKQFQKSNFLLLKSDTLVNTCRC